MKTLPAANDVVVGRRTGHPTTSYVLHTGAGADQLLVRTYDAAVAQALSFARHAHVAAWLERSRDEFELLGDFRGRSPRETLDADGVKRRPRAADVRRRRDS